MIRLPLGDLKTAFHNPQKYAQSFKPASRGGGPSKYGMFLHAIGFFHKTEDLAAAQDYLDEVLTKNFKNIKDLSAFANMLDMYVREWRKQGNTFVRYRDNVTIPVPKKFSALTVSGQAFRIDMIGTEGYGIWMFGRNITDWAEDPKMPLLQYSYAKRLDAPIDSVSVGVYDFDDAAYHSRMYSEREILEARKTLNVVLSAIMASGLRSH